MRRFIIHVPLWGLLCATALNSQEVPRVAWDFGGGFSTPVGTTGRNLNTGWNIGGGVGYNFTPYLGVLGEAKYSQFGINAATLGSLGFPGGDVSMSSFTLNPIVHLNPKGPLDVYLIGGGGLYRRNQEFTAPSVQAVLGYNPFFGFYRYGVPVTEVLTSYSLNKPGVNIGAGLAVGVPRGKVFFESRYHRMLLGNSHTDIVDVTVGFRR